MKGNLTTPQILGRDFDESIEYIRKNSMGTPKKIVVDLTSAQANLELNIAANFLYVKEASDPQVYIDVRFNEIREPAFRLRKMQGFYTPFYKFYLTNPAQAAGEITLVYGTLAKDFIDIIDNRDATFELLEELQGDTTAENNGTRVPVNAAATQLLAANANRKSAIIQHDPVAGVGFICLGFTNAVTVAQFFMALAPGDVYTVDDYRGTIFGIRTGAATNAQVGEV